MDEHRLRRQSLAQIFRAPRHLALQPFLLTRDHLLRLDAIGHIQLRGEKELQLARCRRDWADVEAVPERLSVLSIVQDIDRDIGSPADGVTNGLDRARVRAGALQEAAIRADHLVPAISRQLEKGGVGEDDRIVALPRVGDDHRHPGRPDRRGERIALTLLGVDPIGLAPIVNVTHTPTPSSVRTFVRHLLRDLIEQPFSTWHEQAT